MSTFQSPVQKRLLAAALVVIGLTLSATYSDATGQAPQKSPPYAGIPAEQLTPEQLQERIEYFTKEWKATLERKIAADPALKDLTGRNRYYFIHAKALFRTPDFNNCGFNFIQNTMEQQLHQGDVHFAYHVSGEPKTIDVNITPGSSNLIADLGPIDFDKNVDPRSIDITRPDGWYLTAKAREGHVYLIRVFDERGSRFFVQLKIFHVEPNGDFIAFVYRILPGGVVRQKYLG